MQQDVKPQDAVPQESIDPVALVNDLNNLLRIKTTVIGMKMFATAAEMDGLFDIDIGL